MNVATVGQREIRTQRLLAQQLQVDSTGLWTIFGYPPEHQPGSWGVATQETPVQTPVEAPVETPVETPERILAVLAAGPDLTLAEVATVIGKSSRAVERASAKLVKEGRLRRVGPRKGGHWEVIGDNDE